MKRLHRFWRPALFLVGLILLLGAVSWVFLPKDNTPESGIEDVLTSAYLAEPEDTLDVVILGDSVPKFSVIPTQLWHEQGIPAFVCASAGDSMPKIMELAEAFFDRQSPKVMILETNLMLRGVETGAEEKLQVERIFPVLRYHDNWKRVRPHQMLRPVKYTWRAWEKGYYLCKLIESAEETDYMRPTGAQEQIPQGCAEYVRELQDLCRENGCQLILCSMPSMTNMNDGRYRALAQLAKELDVPYLDLNQDSADLKLDWSKDTADRGDHLNYWGAQKVTCALGCALADMGILEDHRGEAAYVYWDSCYENFRQLAREAKGNTDYDPEE